MQGYKAAISSTDAQIEVVKTLQRIHNTRQKKEGD